MNDVFKLSGALVDARGEPLPDLLLAIVDEDDWDADDLIGVGRTTEGGRFNLSFLGSEFRQDLLEFEATPDLLLVASALFDGQYRPVWRRSFPELDWSGGEVSLGDVTVEGYDPASPVAIEGEAIPGQHKRAERLAIDDDLVRHCMAEVAPIVEKLTGWPDLLEGLRVDVGSGTSHYVLRATFEAEGIDPDSFEAKLTSFIADNVMAPGMGCALYDPGTHTLVINKDVLGQVGLDALKVMVGHELVHVGQYKHTPGLRAYQKHLVSQTPLEATAADKEAIAAKFGFFTEIEGYAKYIEADFLNRRYYPMAAMIYNASVKDLVLRAVVGLVTPDDGASDTKTAQYVDGAEMFRERQVGDVPARFTLDVSKLPDGARFVS